MNIPQTIGILPLTGGGTIKLGDDSMLVNYLNALKANPNIEFGLHGLDHHSNEFLGLSIPDAESKIAQGNKIIKDSLNIEPDTLIPPYFAYDLNTLNAAKNQGMTHFSAGWNAIDNGHAFKEYPAGLMNIPTTTDFYNWGQGTFYSAEDIKKSCQFTMDNFGTCVLLLHHYTFTDSNYNIDPNKIQILSDVMQWVKSKEAEGVSLETISKNNAVTPPVSKKKFIIFRDDDIAPFWSDASAIAVTEVFRTRNVAHVMSIIPANGAGNKLNDDTVISEYITSIKNDGLVEFAVHGYNHESNEFKDISLADATYRVGESVDILRNVIGENPIAFIAPYHEYNDNTLAAMKTKNLNIISSGYDDITRGVAFKVIDGITHIPVTTDFYNWVENRDNSLDEIKTSCENAMNSFEGCVILIHHHHFVDSNGNVDANKINKLVDVIDWAKSKESSGLAEIVTLKDINVNDLI